ncbi:MAG: DUF1499 domain-containing protein [Burkholderiales bacterium]
MRRALWPILLTVAILLAGILTGRAMGLFAGKRPDSLGAAAGRLAPCKSTPNCVSSQADRGDEIHYIAPIAARIDPERTFAELLRIVRTTERASVVTQGRDYLHAEYRSRVLGFVDDVEFLLDPGAALIHARSASRVGYGDFGVNRDRIEGIRARLAAAGG